MSSSTNDTATTICGVRVTHPDRVLFPEQGASKRDLANYYERACEYMLPYLANRPLTLVRCPDGRDGECFYQKHASASVPEEIDRVPIRERSGKTRDYLLVSSLQGLVATAQIGALELHLWGARSDRLEHPERIVFDLDPDVDLPFAAVRDAALQLRDELDSAHLQSFALLTGGKGIHVIVPLRRTRPWSDVKRFAKGLAQRLAASEPEKYTARAAKAERTGKIYIDWLRNDRGATAIAPYSPRAKAGAPVATPVNWAELEDCTSARAYTLTNIGERLRHAGTVWPGYSRARQSVTNRTLEYVQKFA